MCLTKSRHTYFWCKVESKNIPYLWARVYIKLNFSEMKLVQRIHRGFFVKQVWCGVWKEYLIGTKNFFSQQSCQQLQIISMKSAVSHKKKLEQWKAVIKPQNYSKNISKKWSLAYIYYSISFLLEENDSFFCWLCSTNGHMAHKIAVNMKILRNYLII